VLDLLQIITRLSYGEVRRGKGNGWRPKGGGGFTSGQRNRAGAAADAVSSDEPICRPGSVLERGKEREEGEDHRVYIGGVALGWGLGFARDLAIGGLQCIPCWRGTPGRGWEKELTSGVVVSEREERGRAYRFGRGRTWAVGRIWE
jgi:hypothetical protein